MRNPSEMTNKLQPYHYVWLSEHPHRNEEWLCRMLQDGFHVHHLDGDHDNDAAENLVLIDGVDHLMIHNGAKRSLKFVKKKSSGTRASIIRTEERKRERRERHVIQGQEKTTTRTELLRIAVERANARL